VTADTDEREAGPLVLLCFDGSDDAATAIARAAELLAPRRAVVLTVWEPVATWEPYDPATILSAPMSKLASQALGVDEIAAELAAEKVKQGVALASNAGFAAQGRVTHGKTWKAICDVAGEIDAATIVLGARGLSRVGSLLLGSVSSAVLVHAKRPVLVVPHHGGG
jgi:nucleotide-binding universal stress UspA family protein